MKSTNFLLAVLFHFGDPLILTSRGHFLNCVFLHLFLQGVIPQYSCEAGASRIEKEDVVVESTHNNGHRGNVTIGHATTNSVESKKNQGKTYFKF